MLGIIQASAGSAKIFGMDVWKEAVQIHHRIAYVPGDVHLWENLTGGEVIDIFLRLRGKVDYKKKREAYRFISIRPKEKNVGPIQKGIDKR